MLICEGLFFIAGLIALIVGKFRLYGKRTVSGTRARIVGLILLLPGPVAVLLGVVLGASGGASTEALSALSVFEALMLVAAFVVAIVLTLTAPESDNSPTSTEISQFSSADVGAQKLKQLKEMVDTGLISEEEYQNKRSEIINKI